MADPNPNYWVFSLMITSYLVRLEKHFFGGTVLYCRNIVVARMA